MNDIPPESPALVIVRIDERTKSMDQRLVSIENDLTIIPGLQQRLAVVEEKIRPLQKIVYTTVTALIAQIIGLVLLFLQ